ncbi:MAG: hypothetical protein GY821_13465, partial [Gammaproteobacteria bacterium]|nr:hypothetical protein [Gammaproteobacteria bacterium]
MAWMKDRGMNNQPTYDEIIGELRPSFQQKMSVEIAERKLVGRKWNIFTSIDAFLHETRELVQSALPGLTRQWPDRIRSCLMQSLPPAWDQILSSSNKNYTEIVEWLRAQSAKIQNTPQEEWEEWVKAAHRQNQRGGGSSQNPPKSAPNLNLPPQKCYNCGQAGHKSTNCGFQQQQQQQQQQYRTQGTAPPAQNQNWGPSNQNYGNSQPNQSNMRSSGQSGNAGNGRGGNNNQGYNNNARNSGYNNNYQQNYSNPPRGQSNYSPNQQNRPANFGNRQPQYQQGPQTGYG